MKFSHLADCHLGSWNSHPELKEFPLLAFQRAIDISLEKKVDFILIAGDLFDTAIPPIDVIKFAVSQLKKCKNAGTPVYVIAGSHDFSPTGKTMISVIEETGLITDLTLKEIETENYLIRGMIGKKGALETSEFKPNELAKLSSNERVERANNKFKIFAFHSAVKEYSNPHMSSVPLEDLPKGFDYYASGHIHSVLEKPSPNPNACLIFPGPTFPANFTELEELDHGGFFIINTEKIDSQFKIETEYVPIKLCRTLLLGIDATEKAPNELESEIRKKLELKLENTIVLLKINGVLKIGKVSDINLKTMSDIAKMNGAICLKKSIHITERDAKEIGPNTMVADIENELIEKNIGGSRIFSKENEKELVCKLMNILREEKGDSETRRIFEERIVSNASEVFQIDNKLNKS